MQAYAMAKKPAHTPAFKIVPEKEREFFPKLKITSPTQATEFCRKFYFEDIEVYESVFILMLNRANFTIGYAKISQGGITGTTVDRKLIAKYAIDSLASSVIVCHNHPSGNCRPSQDDINITRALKDTLDIIDVKLGDHLILTADDSYSFCDNGLL
jgi:DNA repair protein RadC